MSETHIHQPKSLRDDLWTVILIAAAGLVLVIGPIIATVAEHLTAGNAVVSIAGLEGAELPEASGAVAIGEHLSLVVPLAEQSPFVALLLVGAAVLEPVLWVAVMVSIVLLTLTVIRGGLYSKRFVRHLATLAVTFFLSLVVPPALLYMGTNGVLATLGWVDVARPAIDGIEFWWFYVCVALLLLVLVMHRNGKLLAESQEGIV
ncbi:hypothetical protein GCM10022261_27140 [Brevibacterium daeguense]|uniref:DUF2975 domain-containing protein n=1 Tax=Brevibacterium daeguense TaxID=909936 RepID=A0ABP8EMG4_9MICO|nr:hypothetical protein [Brevibacterium daeguense]